MFKLYSIVDAKGESLSLEHVASGARYSLPEWAIQIAVDKDGEVWAYESGKAAIQDGHSAWQDNGEDGRIQHIGNIPNDDQNLPLGCFPNWRESATSIDALKLSPDYGLSGEVYEVAIAIPPPRLDGSQLRAKVTEYLDRKVKAGVVGASRARHFLSDIRSEGFTFENYRTADLVMVMLVVGCDLKLTRDYEAFRAIDDAVHAVWGAK